jgi:hypothetical protein
METTSSLEFRVTDVGTTPPRDFTNVVGGCTKAAGGNEGGEELPPPPPLLLLAIAGEEEGFRPFLAGGGGEANQLLGDLWYKLLSGEDDDFVILGDGAEGAGLLTAAITLVSILGDFGGDFVFDHRFRPLLPPLPPPMATNEGSELPEGGGLVLTRLPAAVDEVEGGEDFTAARQRTDSNGIMHKRNNNK